MTSLIGITDAKVRVHSVVSPTEKRQNACNLQDGEISRVKKTSEQHHTTYGVFRDNQDQADGGDVIRRAFFRSCLGGGSGARVTTAD